VAAPTPTVTRDAPSKPREPQVTVLDVRVGAVIPDGIDHDRWFHKL
jgi:hypothetical protein